MSNVVILSGSPRKNGTTDRLVRAFVEGAEGKGNSVRVFRTADLNIKGCLGCNHCFRETGVCVQADDMRQILDALRGADVLVFATPVYYFGVTAQLKLAIDRLYALLKEGMPVKRTAFLITCGDDSDEAAKPSVSMFRQISHYLEWEEIGTVIVPCLHEPDDINGREELVSARDLGRRC
jgi:multimeric flavodoxin WrbA